MNAKRPEGGDVDLWQTVGGDLLGYLSEVAPQHEVAVAEVERALGDHRIVVELPVEREQGAHHAELVLEGLGYRDELHRHVVLGPCTAARHALLFAFRCHSVVPEAVPMTVRSARTEESFSSPSSSPLLSSIVAGQKWRVSSTISASSSSALASSCVEVEDG